MLLYENETRKKIDGSAQLLGHEGDVADVQSLLSSYILTAFVGVYSLQSYVGSDSIKGLTSMDGWAGVLGHRSMCLGSLVIVVRLFEIADGLNGDPRTGKQKKAMLKYTHINFESPSEYGQRTSAI